MTTGFHYDVDYEYVAFSTVENWTSLNYDELVNLVVTQVKLIEEGCFPFFSFFYFRLSLDEPKPPSSPSRSAGVKAGGVGGA